MRRAKRIRTLCGELLSCKSFADVGCDHGYCTQYMLERGLCGSAVFSDISAASLAKAERLLEPYVRAGRARGVCCAGLEQVPRDTEQVLIAGMGGDEIADILAAGFLPPVLVLQPMRNTRRVREFLLANGYAVTRDYTFRDGKFYDLLRAERGTADAERQGRERAYGEKELAFGYDNVHAPTADFAAWLENEIQKCARRIAAARRGVPLLDERLKLLREVYDETLRHLR